MVNFFCRYQFVRHASDLLWIQWTWRLRIVHTAVCSSSTPTFVYAIQCHILGWFRWAAGGWGGCLSYWETLCGRSTAPWKRRANRKRLLWWCHLKMKPLYCEEMWARSCWPSFACRWGFFLGSFFCFFKLQRQSVSLPRCVPVEYGKADTRHLERSEQWLFPLQMWCFLLCLHTCLEWLYALMLLFFKTTVETIDFFLIHGDRQCFFVVVVAVVNNMCLQHRWYQSNVLA